MKPIDIFQSFRSGCLIYVHQLKRCELQLEKIIFQVSRNYFSIFFNFRLWHTNGAQHFCPSHFPSEYAMHTDQWEENVNAYKKFYSLSSSTNFRGLWWIAENVETYILLNTRRKLLLCNESLKWHQNLKREKINVRAVWIIGTFTRIIKEERKISFFTLFFSCLLFFFLFCFFLSHFFRLLH